MIYFCHGLDPLLYYLEAKLTGIPLISIPTAGPMCEASHVEARIDRTSPNWVIRSKRKEEVFHLCPPKRGSRSTMGPMGEAAYDEATASRSSPNWVRKAKKVEVYHLSPPHVTEWFKFIAYADDLKIGITSLGEIVIVVEGCDLLEKSGGVRLHKNPQSDKVKILLLGLWV